MNLCNIRENGVLIFESLNKLFKLRSFFNYFMNKLNKKLFGRIKMLFYKSSLRSFCTAIGNLRYFKLFNAAFLKLLKYHRKIDKICRKSCTLIWVAHDCFCKALYKNPQKNRCKKGWLMEKSFWNLFKFMFQIRDISIESDKTLLICVFGWAAINVEYLRRGGYFHDYFLDDY
jgi:hypothetical protein